MMVIWGCGGRSSHSEMIEHPSELELEGGRIFLCPSWVLFWGSVTKNRLMREKHADLLNISF